MVAEGCLPVGDGLVSSARVIISSCCDLIAGESKGCFLALSVSLPPRQAIFSDTLVNKGTARLGEAGSV